VKVALALETAQASPRARALALGRKLAAGGELVAVACLPDAADGRDLVARLGIREAYFVADPALASVGSQGRAQVLARLVDRVRADLVLVDAGGDGGAGLFSAALGHHLAEHAEWPSLFRAVELARDAARPDAVEAMLDLAGARIHLRVDLPALISVLGEAAALPALDPAQVRSRTFALADLDLSPQDLRGEPQPAPTFKAAEARPVVVTAIDDLLP
jgi:electron transfer flavoprotein alpha/beta subunit